MNHPEYSTDLAEAMAHAPFLRRIARALIGDEQAAEDLVQETWLSVMQHTPVQRGRMRQWLAAVLRNKANNLRRAKSRRSLHEEEAARPEAVAAQDASRRLEVQRRVLERVLSLDEPYRTALHLRYYEGLPPREIALRLDVPVKTVKTRLARALVRLREQLDSECQGNRNLWMSALIPLGAPTPKALAPASMLAGGLAMKKLVLAALVLVLAGVFSLPYLAEGWSLVSRSLDDNNVPVALAVTEGRPQNVQALAAASVPKLERRQLVPAALVNTEGALEVRVRWESGAAATGVGVDLHCVDRAVSRPRLRFARTDDQGLVRFEGLAPGAARVRLDRESQWQHVEVEANADSRLEFSLVEGSTVTGRVLTPEGAPVAKAVIWMAGGHGSWPLFHNAGETDHEGRFVLRGLGSSSKFGARAAGLRPSLMVEVSDLMELEDGGRSVDLRLQAGQGRLAGRVLDVDGAPLAGATVVAGLPGGSSTQLESGERAIRPCPVGFQTDEEGRFRYPGDLDLGSNPVSVTAPGLPTWSGFVEILQGVETQLEVQLMDGAAIEGRLVDQAGKPVVGGKIQIAKEHQGGWYRHQVPPPSTTTDDEGRFELTGIGPGVHELNGSPMAGEGSRGKVQWTFEIASGDLLNVELVLDLGLVIEGHLVDPQGAPVPNWMVRSKPKDYTLYGDVYSQSYPRDAQTNSQGFFRLANLGAGAHELRLSPASFRGPALSRVPTVQAGTVDLEITVDTSQVPDASFVGTLGATPSNVHFTVWGKGLNRGDFIAFDPVTRRFEQGPLMAGFYRLDVSQGDVSLYAGEYFELKRGEQLDLGLIQVLPPGRVELRLVGDVPELFNDRAVSADRPGGSSASLHFNNGVFVSEQVAAGRWLLRLWQEPYFMPDTWVEIVSGETTYVERELRIGMEGNVELHFESEETPWKTLTAEIRNEAGELMRAFPLMDRSTQRGLVVSLHRADLPVGRYTLKAWTDTGLKGEGTRTADAPTHERRPWVVDLR